MKKQFTKATDLLVVAAHILAVDIIDIKKEIEFCKKTIFSFYNLAAKVGVDAAGPDKLKVEVLSKHQKLSVELIEKEGEFKSIEESLKALEEC